MSSLSSTCLRKHFLGLLLLFCMGLQAKAPPTIALLEPMGLQTSSQQQSDHQKAAQFELQRLGIFRVLTQEEIHLKLDSAAQPIRLLCLSDACYRKYAARIRADLLFQLQLRQEAGKLHYQLDLREGNSGQLIESLPLVLPLQDTLPFALYTRTAIRTLFGYDTLSPQGAVLPDLLPPPRSAQPWIRSGAAMGIAALAGGYFLAGKFLIHDNNSLGLNSFTPIDSHYTLSGLPGFFSQRSSHARARAMGGAGVALSGSGADGVENPASLHGLPMQTISLSGHNLPVGNGQIAQGSWSSPFRPGTWWRQGFAYQGDELASELSLHSAFAWDFVLLSPWLAGLYGGLGLKVHSLQVGLGGEGIARSTGYGWGFSLDLGLQWLFPGNVSMGLYWRDALSAIRYANTLRNQEYWEPLAQQLTLGFSWLSVWNTRFALDLRKSVLVDQRDHILCGIEQEIFKVLFVRGGFHQVLGSAMRQWSTGVGLRTRWGTKQLQLQAAYEGPLLGTGWKSGSPALSLDFGF